ncbi:MAG: hypothetical protein Q9166_003684 [cf. Caloplaca sp. 2 TL-2023]
MLIKVVWVVQSQEYANAVAAHAKQGIETSLYPGLNFAKLAAFLQQPFNHRPNRSRANIPDYQSYEFACRYKFTTSGDTVAENLQHPDQLIIEPSSTSDERSHSILFLRGLPSSRWLSSIGSKYRVDPEFFQRHLDFWSTTGRLDYFPLPSLRSSSENLIELCYVSIGQKESIGAKGTPEENDASRQACDKAMDNYTHNLNVSLDSGCGLGTSIVRNFDFQDETHFAIEQRISIYLAKGTTIAWIDTGKPLSQGPDGPWTKYSDKHNINHTVFHPTIQILPQVALKAHQMSLGSLSSNGAVRSSSAEPFAQSATLLTRGYGKSLDTKLMANDPFYALHELFLFCAFSQSQYFNMLELKLNADIKAQASSQRVTDVSDLLYRQSISERHARRLRETIATIEARSNIYRSLSADTSTENNPQQAAKTLLMNYQQLLARAESLSMQCQAQVTLLMNRAMIAESNKAIQQAREITKLTRLAFIFVPLSFTASFCGMNLWPFDSHGGSVWWWFVMSAPLIAISFIVLKWDIVRLWQGIYTGHRKET